MKLVSVHSRRVVELADAGLPPYAVLSHTSDQKLSPSTTPTTDSVGPASVAGFSPQYGPPRAFTAPASSTAAQPPPRLSPLTDGKLDQACEHARASGVDYIWIDELCIDKTSTVDLDDAVNGSRRRLRNSKVCLAYLHDLPADVTPGDDTLWAGCRYWKRAWTLQELILSPRVLFFDQKWNCRGSKSSPELSALLSGITRIPSKVLRDSTTLSEVALAVRISWSVGRAAGREEDKAYSLVALTGATLSVRYGEGAERAFLRLQEELLRDTRDGSILAWRSAHEDEVRGLLARSPSEFEHFSAPPAAGQETQRPWPFDGKVRFSNKGIELQSRVCKGPGYLLLSIGQKRRDRRKSTTSSNIAICFREWNGVYVRVAPASQVAASVMRSWRTIDVARDVDTSASLYLRSLFNSMPCRLEVAKRGVYDGPWQQDRVMPSVTQAPDHAAKKEEAADGDVDMGMGGEETVLSLSPEAGYSPSAHSDGSYLNIGSWTPLEQQRQEQQLQESEPDRHSLEESELSCNMDQDDEDALFSPGSEPDSMTFNSASTSASERDYEESEGESEYFDAVAEEEEEIEMVTTETHSTTTLGAGKEDLSGLAGLILKPDFREQLLNLAYERVKAWIPTVNYVALPPDCLTPLSRSNTSWFVQPETLAQLSGENGANPDVKSGLVRAFRPDGYFHISCPFYAADPERHRACLLEGSDLQTIPDMLRHVRHFHVKKAYCGRCQRDFDKLDERDDHMNQRMCKVIPPPVKGSAARKGVGEYEARRLRRLDIQHRDKNEADRWWHIFEAMFTAIEFEDYDEGQDQEEGADAPMRAGGGYDPYLSEGAGLAVSLVHDFWTKFHKECVDHVLRANDKDLRDADDEDALRALYKSTLKELVNKVYHQHLLDGRQ